MLKASTFALFVAIILLQNVLCDDPVNGPLVGGFSKQNNSECYEAIRKGYSKSLSYFMGHRISKCETQVVAGLNYKVSLHKTGDQIPDCDFVIYMDLSRNFSLSVRDVTTDCVKKARDLGLVVDTSN